MSSTVEIAARTIGLVAIVAIVAAVATASGRTPEVAGKPEPPMVATSAAAGAAGVTADVVIDVAVGTRSGIPPGDGAVALAKLVDTLPHLNLLGLLSYDGGAQHVHTFAERKARERHIEFLGHQGGKRMAVGSPEYKLLSRWIAAGAPMDSLEKGRVSELKVTPTSHTLKPGESYRLKVEARYVDGSTEDVTAIYHRHRTEHRLSHDECEAMCHAAQIVNSVAESKNLNSRKGPMVVIAGSGMATGGRVVHHLKAFAPDPRNAVVFAGYQAGGTRGAALVRVPLS